MITVFTKTERDIIHQISIEEMIPESDVENMIYSQFYVLKETVTSGRVKDETLKNMQIMHFGKFYWKQEVIDHCQRMQRKIAKEKEDGESDK